MAGENPDIVHKEKPEGYTEWAKQQFKSRNYVSLLKI
jgi:hypothetical protein